MAFLNSLVKINYWVTGKAILFSPSSRSVAVLLVFIGFATSFGRQLGRVELKSFEVFVQRLKSSRLNVEANFIIIASQLMLSLLAN